ncbi:RHS repeat-associated core domain-containing protein [Streptomyces sp. NPDC020422]|uniref:RHS repeat-associated core domain-containing protein n=1 Tax=Streptomyces sp. NPDC020422 TaxID=3365074 RepID=UPI00379A3163
MVGSLLQTAATTANAAQINGLVAVPASEKPVAGKDGIHVRPRTLSKGPRTPGTPPKAAWPTPAKATVTLPATTGAQTGTAQRAGRLPLSIAPAKNEKNPAEATLQTQTLDHAHAKRAGVNGLMFTVEPASASRAKTATTTDTTHTPRKVAVTVDYADFAEAFGGGYTSRLHLVELPQCALTTPEKAACRQGTPLTTKTDPEQQTLTADAVNLRMTGMTVLAATASAEGDTGTYKATSLSPSSAWQTNLNTGDFTWQYPMPVPQVPGAMSPSVGLSYSAQSIDGRTTSTNNQGSWIGDGFEYAPGFIERRYKPCADDGEKNGDGSKPGDLCWTYDNAFLTFNGKGGELVPTGTDTWKLQNDDGTKVTRLKDTARGNGDNDGEYWELTTPDGTRYYFGYNRLPGWATGQNTTDSTWTVPVFGNNDTEPCHATAFADSWCQQAWRWNLDFVVDTHSNAMSYKYAKETNSYGRNLKAADDTPYVRGGYLERIDYGLKSANMYADKPLGQVVFTSEERCLPETGVTCAPDTIDTKSAYWYDTPWDLNCKAGTDCDQGRLSPSFWTRKRLTDVTTQVLKGDGTYGKVDSWKFTHRWGMADTDYQLLLDSIQRTGYTATPSITLPKTTLGYTQLPNRLDMTGDGFAPFIKSRLSSIADETGGQSSVNYSPPACTAGNLPTPETNTTRCFPQYYGGGNNETAFIHWFNKYVTTSVTDTDRTGGSPDQVTRYDYLDGAAWHWDDDGLTKDKERTWSQWRGYGHVRVRTGGQGDDSAMKSQEEHYFLRGMDQDRQNTSGTAKKDVAFALDEGEGDPITDHDTWAGFEYKTVVFDKPSGKILSKTVNRPWHHQTASKTRTWGTISAEYTGIENTRTWDSLDQGAGSKWRTTSKQTTFDDATGRAIQVDDFADDSTAADDQCTRTDYATNTTANILNRTSRVETVSGACATTPDRSKAVLSDVRTAYDGGAYGAAPTKGDATATATLKSHDGTKATYLESGVTYDSYGRQLTFTDLTADVTVTGTGAPVRTVRADGRTTTTAYTPASGIPTQIKSTTPPAKALDNTTTQTTTRDIDPLRGQVVKETDTNNNSTQTTLDALGRTSKIWLADRNNTLTPNFEFTYTVAEGQPVAVGTKKLDNNGGQITSYNLYDGQLRLRQTQEPGPNGGRILTDTFYDERGLVTRSFAPYYTEGAPQTGIFKPVDALAVETQTLTSYDGTGRPVEVKQIAGNGDGGAVLQTTKTIYSGDRITVLPPQGGTATTTLDDARGNTIERRQHHQNTPDSTYDTTKYEHTPRGELSKVTDPAGNSWTYVYDQQGRQVTSKDPAKGTLTSTYDDRGQLTSTTDARNDDDPNLGKLFFTYDNLGRKTEVREKSITGTLRAKWIYDTLTGAKGKLAESTRYDNGQAYTTKVTAYDRLYRATRTAVVIPAAEGLLQGTYQTATTYKPSGLVAGVSYSAAGALPGGSSNYTYEDQTLRPITVFGEGMSTSISYSLTGKPMQYTMGLTNSVNKTQVTNTYEWGTQRPATTRVDRQGQNGVDRNITYRYDEAGHILSQSDVSRSGTDNQCYTYDYLSRLTEAWTAKTATCAAAPATSDLGGPAPYWHSYTYDKAGNRLSRTAHDPGGDTSKDTKSTYNYTPPGTADANQLTGVSTTQGTNAPVTEAFTYDALGNATQRGSQSLTWDAEGHLSTATTGASTTKYVYDADGNRLITRTPAKTTLHLGHTEVTLDKDATATKATRYFSLGDGHQAIRNNDGTFAFTLADHQATGNLAVNATDLALSQRRTSPFGESRGTATGTWPGTKSFVGGFDEKDTTGLVHLGAREYDPATGRFISVDPVLDVTESQQMNGYNYANNSPVSSSDPDGLRPLGPTDTPRGDADYSKKHHGSTWVNTSHGWYWKNVQQAPIEGRGTVTVTTYIGSANNSRYAPRGSVSFVPIKPKPKEVTFHGWAMGTNPNYNPAVSDADWSARPPLETWQKVVLGIAIGAGVVVAGAPVAAAVGPEIAAACLANPAGCAETVSEIGTGGAAGGSLPTRPAYNGAVNSANASRLGQQLQYEVDASAAASMFTKDGLLVDEIIARSTLIQKGTQMGNQHLKDYFAAHGGAEQWGKYATPRLNSPGRDGTFDIHFYRNKVSGEIYYYDYKVKFGGGGKQ